MRLPILCLSTCICHHHLWENCHLYDAGPNKAKDHWSAWACDQCLVTPFDAICRRCHLNCGKILLDRKKFQSVLSVNFSPRHVFTIRTMYLAPKIAKVTEKWSKKIASMTQLNKGKPSSTKPNDFFIYGKVRKWCHYWAGIHPQMKFIFKVLLMTSYEFINTHLMNWLKRDVHFLMTPAVLASSSWLLIKNLAC